MSAVSKGAQRGNKAVSGEEAALVVEQMIEDSRLDLGHSFVIRGTHPSLGKIVVVNSAEGSSAIVSI